MNTLYWYLAPVIFCLLSIPFLIQGFRANNQEKKEDAIHMGAMGLGTAIAWLAVAIYKNW